MSVITVSNMTEFNAALAAATGGERIELAPGHYGSVTLNGQRFDTEVTLASADPESPATFETLRIRNSAGLRLEEIDVVPQTVRAAPWDPLVWLEISERVTLADMEVAGKIPDATDGAAPTAVGVTASFNDPVIGYGYGLGMRIIDNSELVLDGVEVSGLSTGIVISKTDDVRVSNAHIHNMRSDGIQIGNSADVVIEDSLFHSFRSFTAPSNPAMFDHADMVQVFAATAPGAVDGLTMRGNVFLQGEGGPAHVLLAGLMLHHPAGTTAPLDDVVIHDNIISHTHVHGFSVFDVRGAEIFNNTIMPAPSSPLVYNTTDGAPRIQLYASGAQPDYGRQPTDVQVYDNRLIDVLGRGPVDITPGLDLAAQGITVTGNETYDRITGSPDWWATEFPDAVNQIRPTAASLQVGQSDKGVRELAPWLVEWLARPGPISETFLQAGDDGDDGDDGEHLVGGAASHTLIGGGGADRIEGGAGWDTLHGGAGDDTLSGGAGGDLFALHAHAGDRDRILDLDFAENDYIQIVDGFARGYFTNAADPDNSLTLMPRANGAYLIDAGDLRELVAHGTIEAVAEGPDAVTLAFDLDRDGDLDDADWYLTLDGITGIGEARAEPIAGGPGDDMIYGSAGDDILAAGPGRDTLSGGEGADLFRLDAAAAGDGADLVADLDFAAGDRLDFVGLPGDLGAGGAATVTDLAELAALVAEGRTGERLVAREIAGTTDLLVDLDEDGHADWTLRLEGISGVAPSAPAGAILEEVEPVSRLLPARTEAPESVLRVPVIDPWLVELVDG